MKKQDRKGKKTQIKRDRRKKEKKKRGGTNRRHWKLGQPPSGRWWVIERVGRMRGERLMERARIEERNKTPIFTFILKKKRKGTKMTFKPL